MLIVSCYLKFQHTFFSAGKHSFKHVCVYVVCVCVCVCVCVHICYVVCVLILKAVTGTILAKRTQVTAQLTPICMKMYFIATGS